MLVSAALTDGPARQLVELLARSGRLLVSPQILDEFARVMQETWVGERVPPLQAARFLAFLERHAGLVRPKQVRWDDNPKDAHVLGAALAGDAVLITGDRRLREGATIHGVHARSIREALASLEEE